MGGFRVTHLAIVDTETTGSDFAKARVVQYGIVVARFPLLEIEFVRECFVDPSYDPSFDWNSSVPEAMNVHKLTPEFLAQNGRYPGDALTEMFEAVSVVNTVGEQFKIDWGHTLFSAWGNDFDAGMVKSEYEHCSRKAPFKYRTFDVRSAAASIDMKLHMNGGVDLDGAQNFGFTSVGLMGWMKRMGTHPFVVMMKEQGAFEDIDKLLGDREAHNALYDSLMTLAALRIVQKFNTVGANVLAMTNGLAPMVGKEVS